MTKLSNTALYISVGLSSLLFFLYLSFPYNLLKDSIVLRINRASQAKVQVEDLSPSFPLGVELSGLNITYLGSHIALRRIEVHLSVVSLLTLGLGIDVHLEDSQGGHMNAHVKTSLFSLPDLLSSGVPERFQLEARRFVFGDLINFLLQAQAKRPEINPLLKPWLESLNVAGNLEADIDLRIRPSDLNSSSGNLKLQIANMILSPSNPEISIPEQAFSQFEWSAQLASGRLTLSDTSGVTSEDLSVVPRGHIIQKPQLSQSEIDATLEIELRGKLLEEFGFLIDTFLGLQSQNKFNLRLQGPLSPGPSISML